MTTTSITSMHAVSTSERMASACSSRLVPGSLLRGMQAQRVLQLGRPPVANLLHCSGMAARLPRAATLVAYAEGGKMKVLVSGAGGRTGKLVMQKLLAQPDKFEAAALLRSDKGADDLRSLGAAVYVADIGDAGAAAALQAAMAGCDGLVIATSAVPQIKKLSLVTMFFKKLLKQEGARPEFTWKGGQTPEVADWLGQKAQVDAAAAAGVRKVVLVGSMGGTQLDNMLNKIGDGNILVWKRKAEEYLIGSGLNYTIIHPGGLVDDAGGEREIVVDVDDKLLQNKVRSIPRADVAELCMQCLTLPQADNRSFDAITREGPATKDFAKLLADMSANCDYSLPKVEAAVAA